MTTCVKAAGKPFWGLIHGKALDNPNIAIIEINKISQLKNE